MGKNKQVCLTYVGDGTYILGVPTTDLHEVPAEEARRLIDSGLYREKKCVEETAEAPTED